MKISLIIPALNEEESLPPVLAAVPPEAVDEVIVVDNGSIDQTATVASRAGARVVLEPKKGYGAACWAGFTAAADADILVFMDADGSFLPAEIPRLTAPITSGSVDLVLGTRTLRTDDARAIPIHARLGNRFIAGLIRLASTVRTTDLGPFRAIRRTSLEQLGMQERTYGWPCEMIVKAGKIGLRVLEVAVSYQPRTGGESKVSGSFLGSIGACLSMLKVMVRCSLWAPESK
jgi:glycosyltransferase involved in cell wall biosynthesis